MGQDLSIVDLNTAVNHEPRVAHQRLAEALGYGAQIKMKHLVERNIEALQRFGEVSSTVDETGPKGGRPGKTYWLNKKQALYLCTKSETANATDVTIQMVEVFDAYQRGAVAVEKPVKVRAHRRRAPLRDDTGGSVDLHTLYEMIFSAKVRLERGQEASFGDALFNVIGEVVEMKMGQAPFGGKALVGLIGETRARLQGRYVDPDPFRPRAR
ncbi:hypothetical protein [Roseixanthobacter glucoisosaccharinicivorans]|uniref:hypothetical protein n=1 Tax=Roseixanthobacter glucoisosaccharinicivorans TaxID=3119923 RepID=UPI00372A1120